MFKDTWQTMPKKGECYLTVKYAYLWGLCFTTANVLLEFWQRCTYRNAIDWDIVYCTEEPEGENDTKNSKTRQWVHFEMNFERHITCKLNLLLKTAVTVFLDCNEAFGRIKYLLSINHLKDGKKRGFLLCDMLPLSLLRI